MSQLVIYNWMPWSTKVVFLNELDGSDISENPLSPSTSEDEYFPASIVIPRDLTVVHGQKEWGRINSLAIHWDERQQNLYFTDIKDPPDAEDRVDLLLWVFPDRVVFSQGNLKLTEVYPDKQQDQQ